MAGDPRLVRVLGACVACIAVAVTLVSPRQIGPLPPGMSVPVVAFEVARTSAEIERMFGAAGSAQRGQWRARMALGVWLDYALLLAYGFFLSGVAYGLRAFTSARLIRCAIALSLIAAACDALENRELLIILGQLGGDHAAALGRLGWFTWLKWLALGAYFALLARALWRTGVIERVAAVAGCAGGLAALVALIARGAATDVMSAALALAIGALGLGAFFRPSSNGAAADAPM